jgi:lipopolysaccharide export system protein LptA
MSQTRKILCHFAAFLAMNLAHAQLPENEQPLEVGADQIECQTKSNRCIAHGSAQVVKGDFVLQAQEIEAVSRKNEGSKHSLRQVVARKNVKLSSLREKAKADEAYYDADQDIVQLKGHEVVIESVDGHVLTAQELIKYDRRNKRMDAKKGVMIQSSRGTVFADAMTAYFMEDQSRNDKIQLKKVEAQGNVIIRTQQELLKAPKAIYYVTEKRVEATGGVVLFQNGNLATGSKASVNFETGLCALESEHSQNGRSRVKVIVDTTQQKVSRRPRR